MASHGRPHSIWLMPDEISLKGLNDVVTDLASQHHTPVFTPHVTLAGELAESVEQSARLCREYFENNGRIEGVVTGLKRSNDYFLSIYLTLSIDMSLVPFQQAVNPSFNPVFEAHISLAYGIPEFDVISLKSIDKIDFFIKKKMTFDRVSVVHSTKFIPPKDWAIIDTISLFD